MGPAKIDDIETQEILMMFGTRTAASFLIILLVATIALGVFLHFFRKRNRRAGTQDVPSSSATATVTIRPTGVKLSLAPAVAASLRSLSFRDALNFDRASSMVEKTILEELNRQLPKKAVNFVIETIQVIDLLQFRDVILARFPEAAHALLSSKRAALLTTKSGHSILQAIDLAKAGKPFLEHAKGVDPNILQSLAKMGTFITGAAHIIAGYDNAKRLKHLDKKLDVLISDRSNDMLSELEAIYESLREAVTANIEVDQSHLLNLRFKLKRLRCSWINQVEGGLSRMENPQNRSFVARFFSLNRSTSIGVFSALTAQEEPLYLTRFALTLEQMIALSLGEEDVFDEITVPEVRRQVHELGALVLERKGWISKLSPDGKAAAESVAGACDAFEQSTQTKKAA